MDEGPVSYPAGEHPAYQAAEPGDAALVERAQRGDSSAFEALVRLHQQTVFAVALRMLGDRGEAEEIAQEAFVRAYRSLGTFRREAKLSTWLISITMNLCRNRRRWWARRRRIIVASLDEPRERLQPGGREVSEETVGEGVADPSPSPAMAAEQREQQRFVISALQQLDEAHRSVIILRDLQGYSYEEIAEIVHCQVGTVKSRLSRARLHLRSLLDGKL